MRRTIITLLLCLLTLDALALGPWTPTKNYVEGYANLSISSGTQFSAGATYIRGKQHTKGFFLGAGGGMRYVRSEREQVVEGDVMQYRYGNETVCPVFVRARFGRVNPGKIRPFVTADIGTVLNFSSEGNTKGFFFDPQIGIDFTDCLYVTLGVDTHHFLRRTIITAGDVIGTIRNPEQKVKSIMSSGLSVRVGYSF